MKRGSWLIATALALSFASPASARRVVHIPKMAELCPGNADWNKVEQCVRRHGQWTLERDTRDVKLLRLPDTSRFAGFLLYVNDRGWKIRGELRQYHPYEVLAFKHAKLGPRTGYLLELGGIYRTSTLVDQETTIEVSVRHKLTAICLDDRVGCMQVVTACDTMYRGRALYTFRGSLVYEGRELKVVGDRSNAGPLCSQSELVLTDR
jgi:hypothetical protein